MLSNIRKTNDFHVGQIIKDELARQGRTISWLAQELGCTRDNLYKIFKHSFVNTDLLFRICAATGHDFFKDCSDNLNLKPSIDRDNSVNKNE